MTSAFISYSRHDKAVADFVAAHLRNRDVAVFIDYQELQAGDFVSQLGRQIEENEYFLVVITPRSVASKWVRAEVSWAFNTKDNCCIIPIWLEPTSLTDVFVLAQLERIDFTRWNDDRNMEEAICKLARLMCLSSEPIKNEPVPEPMMREGQAAGQDDFKSEFDDGISPPSFAKRDITSMFQSALATQYTDPERALFLYQQVLEIDPEFMSGKIKEFVETQTEKIMPTRLYLLEKKAEEAKKRGQWEQLKQLASSMIDIYPSDSYAKEQITIVEQNINCEPIYKQAQIAQQNGSQAVITNLMSYIAETCPDYGDPSGLLTNQPITKELVRYIRNTKVLDGHTGPIERVVFSASGSMIATTSADDTLKIWSVASGQLIKEFRHSVNALRFSPDEKYLAVASRKSSVDLILIDGWELIETFLGNTNCNDLVFSNDSKLLITGWQEGLMVHNVPKISEISNTMITHGEPISLVLSRGGLLFANIKAINSYRGRVWNTSNWENKRIIAFENSMRQASSQKLLLSSDERFIAYEEHHRSSIIIRELLKGSEYWKYEKIGEMPAVNDFTLSPCDATFIILVGENDDRRRLLFYDMVMNERIADLEGHFDSINSVDISPDGRFIVTGSDDCTAKIWQL